MIFTLTRPYEHTRVQALLLLLIVLSRTACGVLGFVSPASTTNHHHVNSRPLVVMCSSNRLFPSSVYDDIQQGKIAVIPDFLPLSEVATLRRDAQELHAADFFSTDALASYGTSGQFDPSKDRAVLKLQDWKNHALGNAPLRQQLEAQLQTVRSDLAVHLDRPGLADPACIATTRYGQGSTEVSYTRFGPGAFLKRHVDEHHEELKGAAGWSQPTRRSLSWLVYLNEDWRPEVDGGCLRCYERTMPSSHTVGARQNGDLQVGWLRATAADPVDRPVFLNAQRVGGKCALYMDDDNNNNGDKIRLSNDFSTQPIFYVSGATFLAQKLLLRHHADRFHLIEPPKSKLNDWLEGVLLSEDGQHQRSIDIPPVAGTLVVFDSVALPHEVLPTLRRERWACSGWMHEDQQNVEGHPDYSSSSV